MLRPRALIPSVTVGLVLGAVACNLTPDAMTTDSGGSDTEASTDTADTDTGGPTTGGPTTDEPPTTSNPATTDEPETTTDTTSADTDTTAGPTTETGTTGPDLDNVTIYDIQGGEVPEGSVVTVKGVVITSPVHVDGDGKGTIFVQDPMGGELSGIAVFLYEEVAMNFGVKPGVIVDITGEYTEFFGESQLQVTSVDAIVEVGQGESPAPAVVAAADVATDGAKAEAYEGVLVQVENVTVTNPAVDMSDFEVEGALRINDFFLFAQMEEPTVVNGQVFKSIAGPLRFSYDNHKIAPRAGADLVVDMVPQAEEHTIYEIQEGTLPVQTPVLVKGAIVTSPLTFKKDGFFIQDPMGGEHSGIYVYIGAKAVTVEPGDVVDVEGVYDEYYESSQIEVSDPAKIVVTGNGAVPAPEVVSAADVATGGPLQENYEGVLVTVENVQVAAANMMFGDFELTDGLFVDDIFFAKVDWTLPKAGDTFTSLTGPLTFGFEESRLLPRTAADIKP
ncbi:hypothetical protein [Nannocystis punicea]|uniref:Uncharacterized protein n=1 Tax=Nannocystis punicea TaxID=2995304 RepID=A0ABY7HAS1_9BACT|nr:hypothetical protein [Nannocystis poenicansa]WAS96139.1 hypothetical protein O0S08_08240 [Nannocystis poenicansa]